MTPPQFIAACPRCGRSADVHAISELADLARLQLGQVQPASPTGPAQSQPGYLAEPQAGPLPDPGAATRRPARPSRNLDTDLGASVGDSVGDVIGGAVAGAAISAAAGLIGRAIRKRAEKALTERVMPAVASLAADRQSALQQQIAIAERYPALRACLADQVVFLDGGSATVPLPDLATLTMQQADSIVSQLREA